ncbi:DsbA family oxidoreductase [Marinilongibacter aquaticus]|uniref:DsbA family oxidoreductase n=1 Tax=Marinilongibacter aquaticus TaxID=2975157 RepID=UPI0021BDA2AA|nr:DsbA family oxidoreductase [Marinilongibacter aquaticus]UBM57304.1 DsbA family oxidoreductase [Marinilongibacter aquaticus]
MKEKQKITIDVVSDVACPWCFVGKKNLEKAISANTDTDFQVNWHPFQLDPTLPESGQDRDEYMANKFGSVERFEMMTENLVEKGNGAGIQFDFGAMKTIPNTLKMHKLLHEASKAGFATELKEALFEAYFEKGLDMSNPETLVEIMTQFGWEKAQTESVLDNQEITYWVSQEMRNYQNMGVRAVPFFIINNKYGLSGAQPAEVFAQAFSQIEEESLQQKGEACDINDPNC